MPPRASGANPLTQAYENISTAARADLKGTVTSARLLALVETSLNFLNSECTKVPLVSKVAGKSYFAYAKKTSPGDVSRPANTALFVADVAWIRKKWQAWQTGSIPSDEINKLTYTMATAYSLASDLFDRNNKKGPATYFEHLVGHLFARQYRVNPTKEAHFTIAGESVSMTMDFLFDLGANKPKLHLPVKLSTRERVVQAWSHQRMLDAYYGDGTYRAILVVHSETKLDSRNHEVIEITVPRQWLTYQVLLAKMDGIYFFDMPDNYATLGRAHPDIINVKTFGEFFMERAKVVG